MMAFLLKIWKALKIPTGLQLFIMRRLNDQFLIGATGIFLDDKKKILLFKHTYRDHDLWSLPGGYIKSGEHPREGIEREVKEESGLVVSADESLKIRTDRASPRLDIVVLGRFIGGEFKPSKEVEEVRLFSFKNLPKLPRDQFFFIAKALNKV